MSRKEKETLISVFLSHGLERKKKLKNESARTDFSPLKKMTLNDIYEWIVKNIQYFKNDSDTNSSVAWKNSVRHNLSLHPIFQKEAPVAVRFFFIQIY